MGSHNVTCYMTQVNMLHLNPTQLICIVFGLLLFLFKARSGAVWTGMAYRHFLGHLESTLALLFWEKSYQYALQAILWDLGNWSLMFASICGQNSVSLRGQREGRHSNHTHTYFFPLWTLFSFHFMCVFCCICISAAFSIIKIDWLIDWLM